MDFILRLKAWQLFLIFISPALIPVRFLDDPVVFAVSFLFLLVVLFWIYSIGVKMNALVPVAFRSRVARFKIYCLLVLTSFAITILWSLTAKSLGIATVNSIVLVFSMAIAYFYFIFSIFMFAARMLKTMKLGYPASNSDAIGEFFLIWMFPIGVWIIQPMVNKILARHEQGNDAF